MPPDNTNTMIPTTPPAGHVPTPTPTPSAPPTPTIPTGTPSAPATIPTTPPPRGTDSLLGQFGMDGAKPSTLPTMPRGAEALSPQKQLLQRAYDTARQALAMKARGLMPTPTPATPIAPTAPVTPQPTPKPAGSAVPTDTTQQPAKSAPVGGMAAQQAGVTMRRASGGGETPSYVYNNTQIDLDEGTDLNDDQAVGEQIALNNQIVDWMDRANTGTDEEDI